MMNRGHLENRTRLSWWFPRIPNHISVPQTVIIPHNGIDPIQILDGEIPSDLGSLCIKITNAGKQLGWPLFLRTDYLSGKHRWKHTCHVSYPACVQTRVVHLVEASFNADLMGFPTDCWIARKFIPTTPAFNAFQGDMPIVKERRYFVQDEQVVCHHPYWPSDAFTSCSVSVDNWKELLDDMNIEDVAEVNLLSKLSSEVGAAIGGAWSIDWLWSEEEDKWYLIDMAEASQSYHWPGCPYVTNV